MELTAHNGAVELAIQARGAGRPIVLVHGHGTSSGGWDVLAARLEQQYTVVTYDRRGHGRSASADSFTIGDLTADLEAVIRRLELEARC
jgi:non-heme chloroperoxidase